MLEKQPARAIAPRRSISLCAVALTALVFAAACNDSDAVSLGVAGASGVAGSGAAGAGGVAGAGAPGHAGASGAPIASAGGDALGEAGAGGAPTGDAGASGESEAGAAGEPGQVTNCAPGGDLFLAGNYVDTAGNRLLLRSAAKAATFAIVPAGAASPAKPPRLFAVERICAPGGALIAKDATSRYRVDFAQTGLKFAVCIAAPVSSLDAALGVAPANAAHVADNGCTGKPFTVYTAEVL